MGLFDLKPTGDLHPAWRVAYTHINGEIHEATFCAMAMAREGIDAYFKRNPGVRRINSTAVLHYHDSLCQDKGIFEAEWFGEKTMNIKWERK